MGRKECRCRTCSHINHLRFDKRLREQGKKTDVYDIINIDFEEKIGIIHWRGGWRQYVSRTNPEVDMSRSCNKEVNDFIDKLMEERRRKDEENN